MSLETVYQSGRLAGSQFADPFADPDAQHPPVPVQGALLRKVWLLGFYFAGVPSYASWRYARAVCIRFGYHWAAPLLPIRAVL